MVYLAYALQNITRNPRRTFTYLFGLVLAVGLFAGILFFVDASSRRMTQAAVQSVKVDLQIYSTLTTSDLNPILDALHQMPDVVVAQPLLSVDFAGASNAAGDRSTAAGKVFIVTPEYFRALHTLRLDAGSFNPQGALVSQQLFGALGLRIGDTIMVDFAPMAQPVPLSVIGIVDTSQAPYLFAATNPAHGGEFNPIPNNIFITPSLWNSTLVLPLTHPTLTANGKTVAAQTIQGEVDVQIDHTRLPNDPLQASLAVDVMGRHLASQFPGEIRVTTSLGDALTKAKSDALWAKLLFLFLGMPGVALAAYLSKYATDLLMGPQRQEISLLRARGATPRQILVANGLASVFTSVIGTLLGLAVGLATTALLLGPTLWQQANVGDFLLSAFYAFVAGLALTTIVTYLPIRRTLHQEIAQERQELTRAARPAFWTRAYLDLVSLAIATLLLVVNWQGGGVDAGGGEAKTLSFGFLIFLAPLFLWLGATLLLARVMGGGIRRSSTAIRTLLHAAFGDLGDMAGREIVRRAREVGAAVVIVALAVSFGTSLAIFTRTYHAQKAVDARNALGADVQIMPAVSVQPTVALGKMITRIAGVRAVTPIKTDQVYIGSTLQPVFGIDPTTLAQASFFPDSYFLNLTTAQAMQKMAATPNGVLMATQLADAYSVQVGDPILFRALDRTTTQYAQYKGKVVGILTQFPASAHNSFLVMNLPFLQQTTHDSTVSLFLASAVGSPSAVAQNVRTAFTTIPMQVQDSDTAIVATGGSLTSLNIVGLGTIESLYTLIIASVGLGIFLMAMVYQRAREFGTLRALGGIAAQVSRFLWSESLTISLLALTIGAAIGFLLSHVFVLLLRALFTIPPTDTSVPWTTLAALYVFSLAGMIASTLWVNHQLNRMEVDQVLREL